MGYTSNIKIQVREMMRARVNWFELSQGRVSYRVFVFHQSK
jgi:hypothetical protein